MKRVLLGVLVSLTVACALTSAASAAPPPGWPSISASFSPSTVSIGDTTELTITLSGGDRTFDIDVSAWLQTGLTVAASSSSQCGGTLTTTPAPDVPSPPPGGADEVTLSGASLASGGSCSFSVPVTAESAGQLTVEAGVVANTVTSSGSESYGYGTTAVLTVPGIAAPALVTSAFTPSTVTENGTTTWTVQIANPNASTRLTGLRFFVIMPITTVGVVPEAVTRNDCGGNVVVTEGIDPATLASPGVNYGGGSIAPGATCAITVTMVSQGYPFGQATVPVTLVSNEGGTSAVSNAVLTSLAPPTPPGPATTPGPDPTPTPSNTFTHTRPKLERNGTITETVKLPGEGAVRLREIWRGKLVAEVRKTIKTGEKLTIKLVPSAATRRALKSHRAAKLKLSLAYTPAGGKTRTADLTARTPR